MLLIAWAAACGGPPASCRAGFTVGDDGLCYEASDGEPTTSTGASPPPDTGTDAGPPTLDDVLAALPPCTSATTGDGGLDLVAGCAEGACVGETLDDFVAALGHHYDCQPFYVTIGTLGFSNAQCTWRDGVEGEFADDDEDGLPDDGARALSVTVQAPFAGATRGGLGLGDELSCFVDFADPDDASFTSDGFAWGPTGLSFGSFLVEDLGSIDDPALDGRVDLVEMLGGL